MSRRLDVALRALQCAAAALCGCAFLPRPSNAQVWVALAALVLFAGSAVWPDSLAAAVFSLAIVAGAALGATDRPWTWNLLAVLGLTLHHQATAWLAACPGRVYADAETRASLGKSAAVQLAVTVLGACTVAVVSKIITTPLPDYIAAVGVALLCVTALYGVRGARATNPR